MNCSGSWCAAPELVFGPDLGSWPEICPDLIPCLCFLGTQWADAAHPSSCWVGPEAWSSDTRVPT